MDATKSQLKYDKVHIEAKDIQRLFLNFVRVRIRADFVRMSDCDFDHLWCQGNPPMASTQDGRLSVYV